MNFLEYLPVNVIDNIIDKLDIDQPWDVKVIKYGLQFTRNLKDNPIFRQYYELNEKYQDFNFHKIHHLQTRDIKFRDHIYLDNGRFVFFAAPINCSIFDGNYKIHNFYAPESINQTTYDVLNLTTDANIKLFDYLKSRVYCENCGNKFDIELNEKIVARNCETGFDRRMFNIHVNCNIALKNM